MSKALSGSTIAGDETRASEVATDLPRRGPLPNDILQKAILNSVDFAIIATDANGIIRVFNPGAERMLGYAASEVVNKKRPDDFHDPQQLIARTEALSAEFGTAIAPGFETLIFKPSRGIEDTHGLDYIRKDGSRFPADITITALRDDEDRKSSATLRSASTNPRRSRRLRPTRKSCV